jgi:hypothetical protein
MSKRGDAYLRTLLIHGSRPSSPWWARSRWMQERPPAFERACTPIIAMVGALALDALQGKVPNSCRRAWLGDPSTVTARAGTAREAFDAAMTRREFTWP